MNTPIVMTVIAKDRPGLVEMISAKIAECGGNWEESRMSRLGGQFAGILKIQVESAQRELLIQSLEALDEKGLKVIINEDGVAHAEAKVMALKISVVGQDHPGIIRDLSTVLLKHEANVEELHTELQSEPMSGYALFVASIKLILPPMGDAQKLKVDLESVAADLMVDLDFLGEQ